MSEIYINYSSLEASIQKSQRARNEISGYVSEIKRTITEPISRLSGSDSLGYVSTATSLAYNKIQALYNKADALSSYESSVKTFIAFAKKKDRYVSQRIEEISGLYIEKRNWLQKTGDWIYETFCVNLLNKSDLIRSFSDTLKLIGNKAGNMFDGVIDWFKHGNGKYVLNIVTAVVVSVAAVAGVLAAIAAIPATGGTSVAAMLAFVKVGVATAGGVITIVNSTSKVEGNTKAMILKDKPGAARYYGNISSIHDEWKKTDKGGAVANIVYDCLGDTIDTLEVIVDIGEFGLNVADLGVIRDYRYKDPSKQIKGYSFTKENIKKNIKQSMGIWTSKGKGGKINYKKAFDLKGEFLATSYKNKFMVEDKMIIPEHMYNIFHVNKVVKNTLDVTKNISTYSDKLNHADLTWKDTIDTASAVTGLLSYTKFTKVFKTYGGGGLSILKKSFFR